MKSVLFSIISRVKAWFSKEPQTSVRRENGFEALEPRILYSAAPVDAPEAAEAETAPQPASAAPAVQAAAAAPAEGTQAPAAANGESAPSPEPVGVTAIAADQEVSLVDLSEESQQSVSFHAAETTENMQLSLDADGNVEISEEGVVTFRQSAGSIRDLTINGNGLDNHLTVDFSNGSPVPEFGLSYHGHGNVTDFPGDVLSVIGVAEGTNVSYNTAEASGEGAGFNGSIRVGEDNIQFFGLEPITVVGAGGTLITDGSATPATTNITIADSGALGDGINDVTGDGGWEAVTFSGFENFIVRGGDGSETITLASVDTADPDGGGPASALTNITLDGNNIGGTDAASVDTFDLVGPFAGNLNVLSDNNDIIRIAGAGDGAFVVNNATLGAGIVQFEINGTTAGVNHDTITATTVDVTGATLSLSGGHTVSGIEQFTLISTTGGVTGTFAGLAEGATITNFLGSGINATISYVGGGGNDVVISMARSATDDTYQVDNTSPTTIPATAGVLSNDDFITTANLTLNYDANNPLSALGSTWTGGVALNDWNFGSDVTLENVVGANNTRTGITQAYRFTGGAGAENRGLNDLPGDPSNDSATWEFWLRPSDVGDGNQIIFETGGGGDGMAVWYQKGTDNDGNGTIRFTVDNGATQRTLAAAIDRSDFHHVVAVYSKDDSGTTDRVELYIDGVSIDSDATTTALNDWDGGDPSGLGNLGASGLAQGASNGEFQGDISVFRFYESALTQLEIDDNFNAVATPNTVTEINGVGANVGNAVALTNGSVTVNADGSFSYTPAGAGNDSFTYTSSDGVNLRTATVNLTQIANSAPTANDDPNGATDEETPIILDVLANDSDPDQPGQSIFISNLPAESDKGATLTLTPDGRVSYNPGSAFEGLAAGFTDADTFTYTVSDGVATSTATVTVTVTGLSDAIVVVDDTATTDEGSPVSGNVLTNDSDIETAVAGAQLDFEASQDADGNGTWENRGTDGTTNLELDAAVTRVAVGATAFAGITHAYDFPGGVAADTAPNTGTRLGAQFNKGSGSTPGGNNGLSDVTIELWFKPDTLAGGNQFLYETGGGTGTGLYLNNNILELRRANPNSTQTFDITGLESDFIQAVLTNDVNNGDLVLYVNGVEASRGVGTAGTDWDGGDAAALGTKGGANAGGIGGGNQGRVPFDGQIAIYRQYNGKIFDNSEVAQNFRAVRDGVGPINVSEVEGQAANVGSQITLASGATVTVNSDGSYDYDPNGAFEYLAPWQTATDSFTYTSTDNIESDTGTVTITITGLNDLPTANNDTATTDEDNPVTVANPGVTGNDTDADTSVQILSVDTSGTTGLVNVIGQTNIGEVGQLTVDGSVQTVTLNQSYTNAVVIAMVEQGTPAADPNDDPNVANARVFNVTGNSFQIKLQSPATGSAGFPVAETVNYIVLEAGTYELANGARLEAGTISATATGDNNIAFTGGLFSTTPVALTQVMSENDSAYVNSRHRANVSSTGVDIFLEPVQGGAAHAAGETIGFIAIEQSFGTIGTMLYEAGVTGAIADADGGAVSFVNTYTAAPLFVGSQQTINGSDPSGTRFRYVGTDVRVESDEDRAATGDNETAHAAEAIGFFAFEATTGFLQGVAVGGTTGGFTYDPNGQFENLGENDSTTDTFDYTITDGQGETSTATVTVTINGVNDAPVIAAANPFNDVAISDVDNDGDLVSTLIAGQITDADDGALEGIAITSVTIDAPGTGTFEFSIDGGANWNGIGVVSDLTALVLRPTDRVRFVPDTVNFTGGSIGFRAWDQTNSTAGAFGTKIDASTNGGTTPFSGTTETSTAAVANLVKDGDDIIFTSRSGEMNDISVTYDAATSELIITDHNGHILTSSAGSGGGTNQLRVVVDNNDNLLIETNDDDDHILISNLGPDFSGNITLDGGDDQDSIQFNADADLAGGSDVSFTAEHIGTNGADLSTGGDGTIVFNATGSGPAAFHGVDLLYSSFTTEDGALTVTGEGGGGSGFNAGVRLSGSSLTTTGEGVIGITGTGGSGGFFNAGVDIGYSTITSNSTAATAIDIDGTGGSAGYFGNGIYTQYATITAANGGVALAGTGTATTWSHNNGIWLNASDVTGTTLDIDGTGGGGTNTNRGVYIVGGSATATAGDATITGDSANTTTGAYNDGIYIQGTTLSATGALLLQGSGSTGAANTFSNNGIYLWSVNAAGGASTTLNGTGGTGSSGYSAGVYIYGGSIGTATSATSITGNAHANSAGGFNMGAAMHYSTITGSTLDIDGTGGSGASSNRGIHLVGGSASATAGDVTMNGSNTNTTTGYYNDGIYIQSTNVSASAKVTLTGVANAGAGNAGWSSGVYLYFANVSGTTGLEIDGDGGLGNGYNYGAYLFYATADGGSGDTQITGVSQAGTIGNNNIGAYLYYSTTSGANLTVDGTGGGGDSSNQGVRVLGGSAKATAGAANFIGNTRSTTTGYYNTGVHIESAEIGGTAATSITGDGGGGVDYNHGIYMNGITAFGVAATTTGIKGDGPYSEDLAGNFF